MNNDFVDTNTVSITDFKMKTPTLAKVIVSFTGRQDKESIRAALGQKLDHLAAVVEDSFRIVKAGVAVGFIRAHKEIRMVDTKEIRAAYRVMSSNIMMDNKDKSLWELKEGKGGKYLARHGHEDLSELVSASTNRRPDVPRLAQLSLASAAPGEFVAFVSKSGDMDYGFAVRANSDKVQVVSTTTHMAATVDYDLVTSISQVPVKKSFNQKMATAGISRSDKDKAIEYWKQLYSYDPAYLQMVVEQVNADTAA